MDNDWFLHFADGSSLRVREWMLTMNSHGVEISIAGCVAEMVCDPNPIPFFFFFFIFYYVFIVFRYKELRAGLAMERTKLVNQNKQQKKPFFPDPPRRRKILRPKTSCLWFQSEATI